MNKSKKYSVSISETKAEFVFTGRSHPSVNESIAFALHCLLHC